MANKEFDNVQLFAEYDSTVGSSVVNVFGNKSKENIAYSLSKIKNWFPWLVPTNGSAGQILEWYNNVPTWRANTNADTVKQTHSTDTDFHPLVLGAPHSASAWSGDDPIQETTDQVYMNKGIYVKPRTSTIYATDYRGKINGFSLIGTEGSTYNLNSFITSQFISSITTTGNGNGVTAIGVNNGVMTVTKGLTFELDGHTHPLSIATDTGNSQLSMSANTKYKLTAGGSTFIFTTPPDSDTKVTSSTNHYTPSTASGQDKTASASGATAAWSIDVVKGVTLNTDGKGHVTGISVTSGKIPGNPNTDRYVNAASFADDSTNTATSPVKMTLTRAGSDTATVTANIPKVSSTSAGVVPKGAAVSSQSQSTKFLREDGSWAAPSYTSIPSNNVTGSGTSGYLTKWNGTNSITNGPKLGSSTTTFLRNDGEWATPDGTTYSAGTGISLSGTTFSNAGVRSTTINGNYLRVNTNGTNADLTIPYATTASKLGSITVGSGSRPIYLYEGTPTQCDTPASGAYWTGVPYVGSNGVMEIGKYIDFHGSNTSTNDYDYRITAETQTIYFAPKSSGDATYNLIRMQSPDYNQIQFQTTKTGKAYTSTGIVAYPLTTSGQTMLIQSDGNTVVGGGESPRTLYSNSYDNMDTAENETLYLASDSSEIHLITNCQAYSGRKVLKVQDGQLVKSGGIWISARDNAPVYVNKPNTQDGGYYPAWFAKTKSGGWSMGVLSTQDNLYITYTSDTDYSGGTNSNTYQVQFQNKSGTVALTSDLAGYVPMETVTTDTSADNYFTKTEWVNWNKNAGTSTTNLPTANWGILLTKALPSVQVFIPDNASGLYFRRKADASSAATAWWGITGTAGNTYNLANISNTGFGYRTLNTTTVNTTAGSFVFGGDSLLGGVNDWAGIQVEGINDRFQLLINGHLLVRQNDDATISAAGWTAWTSCLRPADVSGSGGITVTQNDVTIGSGSTAATYKGTVTISHSNSITASTSTVFKKFSYDANGHITGTANVAASDIPALNYVPNTQAGVNAAINLLSTGTSTPTDADYYISQYVGGGTTTTTYHRRPMSALWSYVKGKADSIYAPLNHTHAYTVPVGITIKTGSSDQSHITLQTLMTWLITTKGYITSNTARSLTLYTSWSYAGNDILQLTIDGTAYELQLAGVIIEFDGYASDYQTGTFRLRIHSSPTVSFTPASGYTQFPASHIAEYTCNGSSYSPTWKMLIDSGDTVTRTGGGASGTWGISISGSAEKLGTANKGSATKGIYLSGGTPQEMTYSLNSTVNSGTANCIAYYSGANAISSAAKVTYVNANNSASTPATVAGLHIESPTYGNTAANMIGGVAGVFSYGDGGPQIRFKDASSTQAGALIFTADDAAASGTSWHFVSNETDWNVISKRFHAKTSISIGTDKPSTSYNLTVNGTSYFNNTITIKGTSSGNASINYASYGNARNYASIKFYDGADHGNGVQVGGGGLTVLGGGESAQAVFNNLSTLGWSASDEVAIVASDGPIYFMSNCDTFANRKSINIDTSGYLNTGYINMNVSDQDSTFSTASSIIYSNSDKYLRRVSLTKLGSTLGPYVGPYVTNVSDGSVIHQTNYNSAGGSRPVHRFIRSLRANKLAFTLPANITMEYSTNAGSSWASFGYTDAQKAGPFISRHFGGSIAIGPASGERTTSMQTRITITNDGRDCMIDQFYIWMSTSGHGTTVDIQYSTQSAKTTWVDWRMGVGLGGWSGPNVINVSELRYGATIYSIRFTFKITSVSSDYKTQPGTIYDIQAYGAMACWTSKNNMMMHDSLYTWNHDQVATFPAEIRVPTQLRVYHGNYGTIFRSDGGSTYLLVTSSGSAESGRWNDLRPFYFDNSTGYVTLGNGAQVISSSYGALSVIRAGSTNNAGIKFYNNSSTYLGSLALGTANGRFVRFKTDESTAYTIIDTSLLNVTEAANLGLDGGTNAFGYVSGLTKAAWNFQQTDGTLIRQFYNASWKTEMFIDYRTGQMSTRGKNNGTWQDWRIHLDSGNYSSYALPLTGGTMSGNITFNAVTSASYPASSYGLSWSGSTDWAKIYYRVDSNDNGRLVLDIGDDLTARIDFAYNGTTKAYINYEGGATFPYLTTTYRASFATQATTDTADSQLYANGAIEIRETGRKTTDTSINSYKCAPRIGFHWGGVIGKSIAMHRDGIFYFRNQDGISRAAAVVDLMGDYPTAVPIATLNDGCIRSFYHVNGSLTGNMPATNNAVAIIQLNRHPGDYDSQIGFSNNGNIYYRCANGSALTNSTPWVKVAFSSELDSYLPLAGGTVTGTLVLSNTQDTAVDANNSPALIVGGLATSTHLELDCNEIMAKANGTTGASLYINSGTGAGRVYINDNLALHAGNYYDYATNNLGALNSTLGSGSPASATKTFFDTSTVPALNVSTGYNSNGAEYGFLFAKGGDTSDYGTVLRWGYNSLYLEILRKQGGTWKSTDWEKISAGSADYVKVIAKNEIRFLNESGQFDYTNPYQFWFGFAWASGSISGTHLISTYIMGNCSASGSGDNIATVTAKGFVSKTTSGGAGCTMQYNSSTQSLDFVFS